MAHRSTGCSPGAFHARFLEAQVSDLERGAPFQVRHEPEGLQLDAGADLAALAFRVWQWDVSARPAPASALLYVDLAAECRGLPHPAP